MTLQLYAKFFWAHESCLYTCVSVSHTRDTPKRTQSNHRPRKKYKLGTIRNIKGKPRLTLQFATILNLNTLWMIYLQNACIMYVMQWHTNAWNSLDIDWVYIQHNKMHQVSALTSLNVSTKLHPKVLSRQESWQKSWQPTGIRGNLMGQIPKKLEHHGFCWVHQSKVRKCEEATAMVETKQRLTSTKPGCIFLARFSHMHYKHQQAASGQ